MPTKTIEVIVCDTNGTWYTIELQVPDETNVATLSHEEIDRLYTEQTEQPLENVAHTFVSQVLETPDDDEEDFDPFSGQDSDRLMFFRQDEAARREADGIKDIDELAEALGFEIVLPFPIPEGVPQDGDFYSVTRQNWEGPEEEELRTQWYLDLPSAILEVVDRCKAQGIEEVIVDAGNGNSIVLVKADGTPDWDYPQAAEEEEEYTPPPLKVIDINVPRPWRAVKYDGISVVDARGAVVTRIRSDFVHDNDAMPIGKHIAECVNALDGIRMDQLNGRPLLSLIQEVDAVVRELRRGNYDVAIYERSTAILDLTYRLLNEPEEA